MLGGSCHPCCPQPQNWYCYDYRACGCYTKDLRPSQVNTQNRTEPRYFYAMAKFEITQPSYGRFEQLGNTYITKYEQDAFFLSLRGPSQGGFFTYGGDANWPGPQEIVYLRYQSGFDPLCLQTGSSCSFRWEGIDTGATSFNNFAFNNSQLGFGSSFYFYQNILLNVSCTRTGFVPDLFIDYVVEPPASTATNPAGAQWNASTFGNRTRGFSRDFTSIDSAIGVPGFAFAEAFPLITQWPPQPDLRAATITRGAFSAGRCFAYEFEVTYPLKKWSLLPDDGTKAELLTVGTLKIRFGDTVLGGV